MGGGATIPFLGNILATKTLAKKKNGDQALLSLRKLKSTDPNSLEKTLTISLYTVLGAATLHIS